MPAEINNPYPMPTEEEIKAWLAAVDPATASARVIMAHEIGGLFQRPFLRGDSDHSAVFKGVKALTTVCIALLDDLDPEPDAPNDRLNSSTLGLVAELRTLIRYKDTDEDD